MQAVQLLLLSLIHDSRVVLMMMMARELRAMHFNCNLLELHAATTIPIKLDGGASGRVIYDDPPPSLTCTDLSATAVYATHCCGHISTVPDIVMR